MQKDHAEQLMMIEEADDKSLLEYLALLRKHWILIAVTAAVFSAGSAIFLMISPDLYIAESQILVEKIDKGSNSQLQEMMLPSLAAEEDYLGTQVAILTSNKVLYKAARAIGLPESTPFIVANRNKSLALLRGWGAFSGGYKIEAKRTKLSRVITLTVKGRDPKVCQELANQMARVYVAENTKDNLFVSNQMYKWLTDEERGDFDADPAKREEMASSLQSVSNDLELQRLKATKAALLSSLRELALRYKPKHPKVRELANSLNEANQDIEARTQLLLNNMKSALQGGMNISNVRMLDEAVLPLAPSDPNRLAGWLIATLLGAVVGVMLVILRESLNQAIRTENDLPRNLKIPFLGAVPIIPALDHAGQNRNAFTYVELLRDNLELRDAVAAIRTHILFSIPFEKSRRIMFTSATEQEGRSTLSILAALSLSGMGRKILLIDADLRRPYLHKSLGLDQGKGLADYLSATATLDEVVRTVSGDSLSVIVGGQPTNNSSAFLASARFDELMDKLSRDYDRVIVNVPPVLFIPDAMIVAKSVSCAVLVCASGVTTKDHLAAVYNKFVEMNRTLVGFVLNRADRRRTLSGEAQREYRDYQNKYLKLQPYPGSKAPESVVPAIKPPAKVN